MLAFRPVDTGSPQQDWCKHLQNFPRYRRELEEFSVLGDVVVRIADGIEPKPFERVKILSLEYAVKTLSDETDGREFVRCIKAIASPDATSFELEQIAAYYYGEIRRRGTSEVLAEMGLLGMQMEAVTATIEEREIDFTESDTLEQKLTVADQRRIEKAQKTNAPLPAKTPNFDDEDPNALLAERLPDGSPGLVGIIFDKESSVKDVTSEMNILGWNMPRLFTIMVISQNIIKFGGLFLAIAGLFILIGLKLAAPVLSAFGFDEKFANQIFYPFCWGVATFSLAFPVVKEARCRLRNRANRAFNLQRRNGFYARPEHGADYHEQSIRSGEQCVDSNAFIFRFVSVLYLSSLAQLPRSSWASL